MISYKRRQLRNTCENVFFPAFPARAGPGKKKAGMLVKAID